LQALSHDVIAGTSRFGIQRGGRQLVGAALRCGNVSFSHKLAQLDVYTLMDKRAPGATWGAPGETALDA
jgi:xanthine dehydrogenase YagR molybdenum-binding subunit